MLFISCSSLASLVWRSDSYFHHHPCHYHDRPFRQFTDMRACVYFYEQREKIEVVVSFYMGTIPQFCVDLSSSPFSNLPFGACCSHLFTFLSSTFYLLPATACPVFAFMCRQTASPLLNCNTLNICVALPKAPKSAKYFVGFCKVVQI